MTEPPPRLLGGDAIVDGYRILRPIGAGGTGTVFAAEEIATGRAVALKALRDDRDDADARARFEREADAANAVGHPGIVPVLATGRLADGRPYLVLPLLDGKTLREELEARGPLPERGAWEIARQVAEALGAAHAFGVVHRDVKPENVFLERAAGDAPRVRLLDFGIAKRIEDAALTRLTGTGAPLGTPAYMAPEQWWAAPVDGRTDQYALGAVLFEMLTGRPPFEANGFAELLQKHLHESPAPLPHDANDVVRRMLAKEKTGRFSTMADLVREGDRVFSSATTPARAPATRGPAVAVATVAASGAALLVGVGYAGAVRRDVVMWFVGGGLAIQIGIVLLAMAALVAIARGVSSRTVYWLALAPAFFGLGVTYIGWAAVEGGTRRAAPLDRLDVLHEGIFELNLLRFLGFGLAAAALVALAVVHARSCERHSSNAIDRIALGAAGVIAAVAWARACPSVVLVAAVLAATAIAGVLPARRTTGDRARRATALDRTFAVVVAAGLTAAVAFARIEAREAAAWATDTTRIQRVNEIIDAARERSVSTALIVIVLASIIVVEAIALRRAAREHVGLFEAWPRRFGVLLGAVAVAVLADVWIHVRLAEARAAVRQTLAPQFALFAALDPPMAQAGIGGSPRRATTLQVSRSMVAVNGTPVAPIGAMMSSQGQAHVGAEIDRALATAAAQGENAALVSLMVDREVPFGVVRRLLLRARAAGATTADILLTRGEAPHLPDDAPGEAALVKATDFVTLPVVVADDGAEPRDDQGFGEVLPALVRSAGHLRSDVLSGGQ